MTPVAAVHARPESPPRKLKVLVIGATGGLGRALVAEGLARGHDVTAFARDPSRLADERARAARGDALEPADVARAVAGQDVVISTLGPGKRSPEGLCERGTRNILDACRASGVARFLHVTGSAATEDEGPSTVTSRALHAIYARRMPEYVADRRAEHALVTGSGLQWTVVRAPRLVDGEPTGAVRASRTETFGAGRNKLRRADLAAFMFDAAERGEHVGETVFAWSGRPAR